MAAVRRRAASGSPLDRACAAGRRASCAGLVELLLAFHPWVWHCANLSEGRRDSIELPMQLTGGGLARPMELELDAVLPRRYRTVGRCLYEVLSHTEFPPIMLDGVVEVGYGYDFDGRVGIYLEDAIETWRFEPLVVDGVAVQACTQQFFRVDFWWRATWPES